MIFVDLGKLGVIFSAFHHKIGAADLASSQQPIRLQKAVTCVASPPSPARKSLGIAFVLRQAVHHDLGAARSALDTAPSATAERFGGFRQSGVRESHLKSPGNSKELTEAIAVAAIAIAAFSKINDVGGFVTPPLPQGTKGRLTLRQVAKELESAGAPEGGWLSVQTFLCFLCCKFPKSILFSSQSSTGVSKKSLCCTMAQASPHRCNCFCA